MRRLVSFLVGVAAVTVGGAPAAAQFGGAVSETLKRPVPRESMDYDMRVAVSGRVLLEDRQAPPEPVMVEYSCRGANRGALTDAKGRFFIGLGYAQADRTNLSYGLPNVAGCLVQVRIPGYEEIVVTLKKPNSLGDLSLGDLTLKPVGAMGTAVFSESGRTAPAKARGNYLRALDAVKTLKYPDAITALDKAIASYPQYAAAMQLKGGVLELMEQPDAAREAYRQAATADPGYAKPLVQLAELAAGDHNPAEAARWAGMANRLVPGAYPSVYLIEAGACFDLNRIDDAEKAVRAGIDADPRNVYPGLRKLLGEVLYRKHGYAAALEQFEWYLKEAPEAIDIGTVQERVQSCQRLIKKANQ
jgi:tetratricopeptide (TPR) repeat protein